MDRWGRLKKMDPVEQLQRMAGKTATFRSVQKEAIQAIVGGESPVVAVMPTGAGKSMLFMLPAWAEQGGTTVVVVPLIALRGDMKRRCSKLGISCAAWESRHPPDAAAIVLVTPESAVTDGFATFVNRLRATRQLDRIVIDECHIVLNRRYTFRKQMQQLGKLVAAETQMVLLTATLPPSEEDELFRRMHFDADQVKVFRAETARTNVAYRVIKVGRAAKKQEVEDVVLGVVRQKLRRYRKGKVVIYGNSVPKVQALAQQLRCHAYYHDAVGKARMLEDFMSGRGRVIVATSALGMGVDIPDIRCIVHMDWPFSVLDYAQESGRAGRDGRRSEAVMIVQEGAQRAAEDRQEEKEHGLVRALVGEGERERCRRVVLGGYLDRREVERVGCEEGEEKCDVCRGGGEESSEESSEEEETDTVEAGGEMDTVEAEEVERERDEMQRTFRQQEQSWRGPRQRFIEERQESYASMEWLGSQLARWTNRCGICEAAGQGNSAHDVRRCWRPEGQQAQETIEKIEKAIKFALYSGCYWCGVPQAMCGRWEDNGQGRYRQVEGGVCQYQGVLVGGLIGMMVGSQALAVSHWEQRLIERGVDLGSIDGLVQYLGRKQPLDTIESNRLVEEFCWVTRLVAEQI
ncbi:DNA helicase [Paraphaeosphaeria sporulosa]